MKCEDLKVGMRVVCSIDNGWFNAGDIAEVLQIDKSDNTFKTKQDKGSMWQCAFNWEPYKPEFKVGERVRIRSWESMEREYGLSVSGDIKSPSDFVNAMRHLCGREATISKILRSSTTLLTDWSDASGRLDWHFDPTMLEKIEEKKEIETMDKIAEVARILGVVKGEKFDIEGNPCNPWMITDAGLVDKDGDVWRDALTKLILDELKIIKLPFKPEKNEGYWCVVGCEGDTYNDANDHGVIDYHRISSGNCFRTKEEAETAAPEIMKKAQEFFGA